MRGMGWARVLPPARGRRPAWVLLVLFAGSLTLVLRGHDLQAATTVCSIPGDHTTIQEAVDDASCDLIQLLSPAYGEAVEIDRSLEIRGAGSTRTTLSGVAPDGTALGQSIVTVTGEVDVTLSDLALRDGVAPHGAGLLNDGGTVTLERVLVAGNQAVGRLSEGGGLFNRNGGSLILVESTVRDNEAQLRGGGISSSGISVPLIADPDALPTLESAYDRLHNLSAPDFPAFPRPDDLARLGEAVVEATTGAVEAFAGLAEGAFAGDVEAAAPDDASTGGVLAANRTALVMIDSVVEDNLVEPLAGAGFGGGIYSDLGIVLATGSRIADNTAEASIGAFGGGISSSLGAVILLDTEVTGNEASALAVITGGGGISNIAGLLDARSSRIDGNRATSRLLNLGGGIANLAGIAHAGGSTVDGNRAGGPKNFATRDVTGFSLASQGGGIANKFLASLTVEDSSVSENVTEGIARSYGPGILNEDGSSATIERAALIANTGRGKASGGGLFNDSEPYVKGQPPSQVAVWTTTEVNITNATIAENVLDGRTTLAVPFVPGECENDYKWGLLSGGDPGVLNQMYLACLATQDDTTLIDLPTRGAGVFSGSQSLGLALTDLRNVTVTANKALGSFGGAGGAFASLSTGINPTKLGLTARIDFTNSIVYANQPEDCDTALGASLELQASGFAIGDGSCGDLDGDFSDLDPQFIPLGYYGGPTRTYGLAVGSPALDSARGSCPATDQRGEDRSLGGPCDIGAFELTPARGLPDAYAGDEDVPITASADPASGAHAGVLRNDIGLGLGQAEVVTPPSNGTLSLAADGSFTYTPDPDYFGDDGFSYRATDLTGVTIAPVDVTLTVAGRLDVLDITPAPETVDVDELSGIAITFDDPVSVADAAGRIYLFGDRSNPVVRHAVGSGHMEVADRTLTIKLAQILPDPGERLTLLLSDRLRSADGIALARPLVRQYTTAVPDGGGGFVEAQTFGFSQGEAAAVGDLDGDGHLDVITGTETFRSGSTGRIWWNDGSGGLTPGQILSYYDPVRARDLPLNASDLAIGDLDGNGLLDILATTADVDEIDEIDGDRHDRATRVYLNHGNRQFELTDQLIVSAEYISSQSFVPPGFKITAGHQGAELGDLDGDGDLDAFVVAGEGRLSVNTVVGAVGDSVWLNDGTGELSRLGGAIGNRRGHEVALADIDADGDLDAVVANFPDGSQVWRNDGFGRFTSAGDLPASRDLDAGDVNGDGNIDIVLEDGPQIFLGDGTGGFRAASGLPSTIFTKTVDLGDLEGDGDLDLWVGQGFSYLDRFIEAEPDELWINDGTGSFTPARQRPGNAMTAAVALGDLNGDDILDAVTVHVGAGDDEWESAEPNGDTVWFGLPEPVASPDRAFGLEDRTVTGSVLGNDSPGTGTTAVHETVIDTYTAPTLGALWHLLDDLGLREPDPDGIRNVAVVHRGDTETATVVRKINMPEHGKVTLRGDGTYTYTPDPDFHGTDTFTYFARTPNADSDPVTVTITIEPINDAPVANDDLDYPFDASDPVNIDADAGVLANDVDVDGDTIVAEVTTPPRRGTVDLSPDGSFTYTPGATASGGDVFFYRVVDDSTFKVASEPARVKLGNSPPVAEPEPAYTPEPDGSVAADSAAGVLANDSDPDGDAITAVLVDPARHGALTLNDDGSFSYRPGPRSPGSDTFTYSVDDGTTTAGPVRVKLGNSPPVAGDDDHEIPSGSVLTVAAPGVMANDSDIDGDDLSVSLSTGTDQGTLDLKTDGSFTYTSPAGITGSTSFTYELSDGLATVAATVNIGAFDALGVVGVAPAANANGVAADASVSAEVDRDLIEDSLAGRLRFRGHQSGGPSALAPSVAGAVASADPPGELLAGEEATVTLVEGVKGAGLTRLDPGYQWQFRAATSPSSGQLTDSGQLLGDTGTTGVVVGDLDGDGDLDGFSGASLVSLGVVQWENEGDGQLVEAAVQPTNRGGLGGRHFGEQFDLGDLDGDGDLDAITFNPRVGIGINTAGTFSFTYLPDTLVPAANAGRLGDLDADGDLDVAYLRGGSGVQTLVNDASAGFTAGVTLAAPEASAVDLGDLDGDGDLDVVVAVNEAVDAEPVLRGWRNDGHGAFGPEVAVTGRSDVAPGWGTAVDLGDLDGDGDLDAVSVGGRRAAWLNDGAGDLTEVASGLSGVANDRQTDLGDLDGDGDLDVFFSTGAHQGEGKAPYEVFLNDGGANFSPLALGGTHEERTRDAALGDLDGDGDLDALLAMSSTSGSVFPEPAADRLLLNPSEGTSGRFIDTGQRLGAGASSRVVLGDVNGDGYLDAYVFNTDPRPDTGKAPLHELWINDGTGAFTAGQRDPARSGGNPSNHAFLADLDLDGDLDLFLTGQGSLGIRPSIYLNDGSGTFTFDHQPSQSVFGDVVLADADGDVDLDVIYSAGVFDPATSAHLASGVVLVNDGTGSFTSSHFNLLKDIAVDRVAAFDADGDGDLDLLFGRRFEIEELWLNDGAGNFLAPAARQLDLRGIGDLHPHDMDGDGAIDVVSGGTTPEVWFNDGSGTFSLAHDFGFRFDDLDLDVDDVDRDGKPDILFTREGLLAESWLGDGKGGFTKEPFELGGASAAAVALGDLDLDGDPDAFFAQGGLPSGDRLEVANQVWRNLTPPPFGIFGARPALVADSGSKKPFGSVTVTTPGSVDVTVTVALDEPGPGALTPGSLSAGGFSGGPTGPWTLGPLPPADATTALRGLVYDPIDNLVAPGTVTPVRLILTASIPGGSGGTNQLTDDTTVVSIESVNDVPAGVPDAYTTPEGTALVITAPGVLANDTDPDVGDTLTAAMVDPPPFGLLVLDDDGSFSFDPGSATGRATFTYAASDGRSSSAPVAVTIDVTDVNEVPAVADDAYAMAGDEILMVDPPGVLANDTDGDGDALTATVVDPPAFGQLLLDDDGGFLFDPEGSDGQASFTYTATDGTDTSPPATVTVDVAPVNRPPEGTADTYATDEDVPLTIVAPGLLGNDSDPDGDAITASSGVDPARLALQPDGSFTYTPPTDFSGLDVLVYEVSDGELSSLLVELTIEVRGVNDAPVGTGDGYSTPEDTQLVVGAPGVLANDSDPEGDPVNATAVDRPAHGTVVLAADGSFTYTPELDYSGADSFTYTAGDGSLPSPPVTVRLTVTGVDDRPLARPDIAIGTEDSDLVVTAPGVLANDMDSEGEPVTASLATDPAHGSVSMAADGGYTYTPDADFAGIDSFTYVASDGGLDSAPATVSVVIDGVNDIPAAVDDAFTTDEDVPLVVAAPGVVGNDDDVDGDDLAAAPVAGPTNGTVALDADGSFTYTPDADFAGIDTFTYAVNDGSLDSAPATVTITVDPVNDAPVAADDAYSLDEDAVLAVPAPGVVSNDDDVDGDALTATLDAGPSNGTVALDADGSFTYAPDPDFNGADSFSYTASDGGLDSAAATVAIAVNPLNDASLAIDHAFTTDEDSPLMVDPPGLLAGASDLEGDALEAVVVTQPANGSVAVAADGSFTYTPATDSNGADSFTYAANDGDLDSAPATVSLTVNPIPDTPVAADDVYATPEDTALVVDAPGVLANDTDADGDGLTAAVVSDPAHGALVANADGSFTYTPEADYFGPDTFTYTASDGALVSEPATVAISVNPVNDAPAVGTTSGPQVAEYGDVIPTLSFEASDIDAATISATTTWSVDGGPSQHGLPTGLVLSQATCGGSPLNCGWTITGQALVAMGTYTIDVTIADDGVPAPVLTVETSLELTVIHEPLAVILDPANPAVLTADDGAATAPFTLALSATEADDAAQGRGDLALAGVNVQLVPYGRVDPVGPVACTTALQPTGEVLDATCDLPPVNLGLYEVLVTVGGDYYTGEVAERLVVYDPPEGTEKSKGKGSFSWPEAPAGGGPATEVSFDFSAETKKPKDEEPGGAFGGFLALTFQRPGGSDELHATAIDGVVAGAATDASGDFSWAAFTGTATWQPDGEPAATDGYLFVVYVEARASGQDRIWVSITDPDGAVVETASLPRPAADQAVATVDEIKVKDG